MMNILINRFVIMMNYTVKKRYLSAAIALCVSGYSVSGVQNEGNSEDYDAGIISLNISQGSLWGPGQAGGIQSFSEEFGYSQRAGVGIGSTYKVPFLGRFGAEAGVGFNFYTGSYFTGQMLGGKLDGALNIRPVMTNYQARGLGLDYFQLNGDVNYGSSSTSLSVTSPDYSLQVGLVNQASLDARARACFGGCVSAGTTLTDVSLYTPLLDINTNLQRLGGSLPVQNTSNEHALLINPSLFLPEPATIQTSTLKLVDELSFGYIPSSNRLNTEPSKYGPIASDSLPGIPTSNYIDINGSRNGLDSSYTIPKTKGVLELEVGNPFSDYDLLLNNEHFSGGSNNLAYKASLDADALALSIITGGKISQFDIPGIFSIAGGKIALNTGFINGSLEAVDLDIFTQFNLKDSLSIEPEVMVNMSFDQDVIIKGQIGLQREFSGRWDAMPEMALTGYEYTTADGGTSSLVNVDTEFWINANIDHKVDLEALLGIDFTALQGSLEIAGEGLGSFGPLISESVSLSLPNINLATRQFTIDGRGQKQEANSFTLDANGETLFEAREIGEYETIPDKDKAYIRRALSVDSLANSQNSLTYRSEPTRYQWEQQKISDFCGDKTSGYHSCKDTIQNYLDNVERAQNKGQSVPRAYDYLADIQVIREYNSALGGAKHFLNNTFQINADQNASVFEDGQLIISNGDTLSVEEGATLTFSQRNLESPGIDHTGFNGVVIEEGGKLEVSGQLYFDTEAIAANVENPNAFVFANFGDMDVNQNGQVKFDGRTFFDEGSNLRVDGGLESTAEMYARNETTISYGGSLDNYSNFYIQNRKNENMFRKIDGEGNLLRGEGILQNNGVLNNHVGGVIRLQGEELNKGG